jgi:HAD superfamily phosphoserine phosphatase-like hydrolase
MIGTYALFDADGTLYGGYEIFRVMEYLTEQGCVYERDNNRVQSVQEHYLSKSISYPEFVTSTLVEGANALDGRVEGWVSELTREYFDGDGLDNLYPYVNDTLVTLRHAGVMNVLVTAEPDFIAAAIAETLGFDDYISSKFGLFGGRFTGAVDLALGRQEKLGAIENRVMTNAVAAFGDSIGDVAMMELADVAFCIGADHDLRAIARETANWFVCDNPTVETSIIRSVLSRVIATPAN